MSWVTFACGLALTKVAMRVSKTALSSARQWANETVPVAGFASTAGRSRVLAPDPPAVALPRDVIVGPTQAVRAPAVPRAPIPVRKRRRSMVNFSDIVVSSVLRCCYQSMTAIPR